MFKGDKLHPIVKIILGIVLIVGSIYYIFNGIPGYLGPAWSDFKTVVNGIIPPLVLLLGLFIVWLELDELRIERELATEERRMRKKR